MKFLAAFALTWALFLLGTVQAQYYPLEVRYRLTLAQFQTQFDSLFERGYRLNYVSGYTIGNESRFAGIWELKPSPLWVARINLTSSQYQDVFNAYVSAGFRLVLVNGYTVEGQDRYAAIWDKSPSGPWITKYGLTLAGYQAELNSSVQEGYRLRHVSGYNVRDQGRYATIWEKTNDSSTWTTLVDLSSPSFLRQQNALLRRGFRLTDISGYGVGNKDYYAIILEQKGGPAWAARYNLTLEEFQLEYDIALAQRLILKVLNGYTVAGSDRYSAIWEHVPDASTLYQKN